jgi:surface antigen
MKKPSSAGASAHQLSKENVMLKQSGMLAAAAVLALCAGTTSAAADECSRHNHAAGTVLGAVAGGLIGGAVSHGNGGAVVGGVILGGLAGNALSRDIDCDDRDAAERAYRDSFYGDVGERYEWNGRGHGYIVTTREYRRYGHTCRDFTQVVWRNGEQFSRDGTACYRDGEWQFES